MLFECLKIWLLFFPKKTTKISKFPIFFHFFSRYDVIRLKKKKMCEKWYNCDLRRVNIEIYTNLFDIKKWGFSSAKNEFVPFFPTVGESLFEIRYKHNKCDKIPQKMVCISTLQDQYNNICTLTPAFWNWGVLSP